MAEVTTVLAFHAHPDDEALLTGGTLAKLAADGHRVIIVVATTDMQGDPASPRLTELHASARVLGAAKVIHLGYSDSGHGAILYPDPPGGPARFVRASVEEAADRLVELIRAERAELLLSYDPRGGYGHRDHVRVHEVGARAAELTGIRVLEATLPREPIARVAVTGEWLTAAIASLRAGRLVRPQGVGRYEGLAGSYTPRAEITHRIDVREFAGAKRDALAAHRSQTHGKGRAAQVFRLLVRLPPPVFGLLLGREWFVERRQPPG